MESAPTTKEQRIAASVRAYLDTAVTQETITQLAVELFELNGNAMLAPLWKQQNVIGRSSGSTEAGFLSS